MNAGDPSGRSAAIETAAVETAAVETAAVETAAVENAALRMPPLTTLLLVALACSGPTDVVGVVDSSADVAARAPNPAAMPGNGASTRGEPGASDDGAADADEVALLLAGRRVDEWLGDTLVWPLSTPLGELFSGAPSNDAAARAQFAPSRRLAGGSSQNGSRRSDGDVAGSAQMEARLLILDEAEARELLSLLAPAAGSDADRAAVFRDERGDIYQVSLESDERSLDDLGCFGRMHREPPECGGRGSFD